MHKVGVTFYANLSSEEVFEQYIRPLRDVLLDSGEGIYSNYLRQAETEEMKATEHLLIFEVQDFKVGLRRLRVELEKLNTPADVQFHNLDPSQPSF